MFTHVYTRKWQAAGASISKSETLSADGENNRDVNLAAGVVNLVIEYALDVSQLQGIYIVSTKDTTLTPFDTSNVAMALIDLKADVPFVWTVGSGLNNPFASDIGSLQATNLSGSAVALLSLRSLLDSTASNAVAS